MILTAINIVGGLSAAVYLAHAMKHTHGDDRCKNLIQFEWVYLASLVLMSLDQLHVFVTQRPDILSYASIGHTSVWVSAFFFSRHLETAYK